MHILYNPERAVFLFFLILFSGERVIVCEGDGTRTVISYARREHVPKQDGY
ncbi:hypothetical protein AAHE18_04G034900 [Arachis hypogaea]